MLRVLLCIVGIVVIGFNANADEKISPTKYYEIRGKAKDHYRAEEFGKAAQLYEKLSTANPADGYLLERFASSLYRSQDTVSALEPALKAREQGYGSLPGSAYTIAKAHASAGKTDKALEWLQQALAARYEDRPDLKDDPAFENLRSNPSFRELAGFLPERKFSREQGWRYDLDYFLAEAKRLHAAPASVAKTTVFECEVERLKGRLEELTNEQIAIQLQRIIVMLGDGHTSLYPFPTAKVRFKPLPLVFHYFSDGLFVINAKEPYAKLIGKKVVAIGERDTENLLDDLRPYVSRDNDQGLRWLGPRFLVCTDLLQAMGYTNTTDFAVFTVATSDETREIVQVAANGYMVSGKLSPPIGTPEDAVPLWLSNVTENYWHMAMPKLDGLYVQFNQVRDKEGQSIAEYAKTLMVELKTTQSQNLILDLRHNNGGNNFLIWPLIRLLVHHEMSGPNHRVFVITGHGTFSACQNFINFVERMTSAVFVGEPSSSRPNFTGEDTNVQLPYSGLRLSISSRYWQDSYPGDRRPWISIPIPVELSSTDYFQNRDPVLETLQELLSK